MHLCDDEFLDVRIDEIWVRHSPSFDGFAGAMAQALAKRGSNPMFVQTWQRRINQVHRVLHQRMPWIYPKRLFGYAPYDVVLSLLPPVRPGRAFPILEGAEVFTGSDTGTAESCIFAASADAVTVTLWSGADRAGHVDAILARAAALGIGARQWA